MSGGMVVDPDVLEAFLRQIEQFDQELGESVARCRSQLGQLGDVWRDKRYEEFKADWEEADAAMSRYLDGSVGRISFLRRKAGDVRDYLG